MLAEAAAAVLIGTASITDIKSRRIPNVLTFTCAGLGLLYFFISAGLTGLLFSGIGLTCGFVVLLLLYLFKVVGAGDVKLFAALGAWVGAATVWNIFVYSILFGGFIGLALLLFHYRSYGKKFVQMILVSIGLRNIIVFREHMKRPTTFPFMVAVLPAALVVYFTG